MSRIVQELAKGLPNQNKHRDDTASKWMVHRKQYKVHGFIHVLVVSEQDTMIHFF